ncbi:MAG: pyruvate dehydrogenase (acetyl-transferring), homodimeric type [Gemmataceae bacterium]
MGDFGNFADPNGDVDVAETREWLESLNAVLQTSGRSRASFLLHELEQQAVRRGVQLPFTATTPYINTIPAENQAPFPGSREVERRIKSLVRWNAMAMVVRGNKKTPGLGGHISTFASAATLYEVGFNHFFRGPKAPGGGDSVYFQGHAAPGMYARAFLEGRLTEVNLENFRRELTDGGGLSSYPHPWLMPDFWQFPTVSMGLGPIKSVYQARFNRYLHHRGLKDTSKQRIWAFLGDGETDEPEVLGCVTVAARERLDNLTWVINCNLQRLDGPVRGNGKIIQELEGVFRGAGWNVIKVIWGSDWDPLLANDRDGILVRRMEEVVDGEYQRLAVEGGDYVREQFFGKYPELRKLVDHLSDDQLRRLGRGGHDPAKVYAAYSAAVHHTGQPTVILAKTIKGYGLGEAGEGRNITHQAKKLNDKELIEFRSRFAIPISDDEIAEAPFYKPSANSAEIEYMKQRRQELGGPLPARSKESPKLDVPSLESMKMFLEGSEGKEASTTMVFVNLLKVLLQNKQIGKHIVPIIPDEARTFGMEGLFTQFGIYSSLGQLYEPVDYQTLTRYREDTKGQILEEGITEAGSMSSFIAAGTSYSTQGLPMIPMFIYYSMFGFQRIGDLIWAAADSRCRGFLLGGTAGRTTLNGEGLQHQDGHSHLVASTVPTIVAYDPAYAYELAVIIQDGIRRMYQEDENVFYYITVGNENYAMPPMPGLDTLQLPTTSARPKHDIVEGILKGMYKFRAAPPTNGGPSQKIHLLGSAITLNEAVRAQEILAERFNVAADVWSVTSYPELRREALDAERWNRLHPTQPPRQSYLEKVVRENEGIYVASSDYMKVMSDSIAPWVPGGIVSLGTDGFGRSETREALRRFFEVDAECIVIATLYELCKRGQLHAVDVEKAIKDLGVDPEKADPTKV